MIDGASVVLLATDEGFARLGFAHSDAVEILSSGPVVDIIFSDVVMPGGMSGFDVCRWVRMHRPQTRLLLASGFADKALEQQEVPVADVEILRKPYGRGELARAMRRALDA